MTMAIGVATIALLAQVRIPLPNTPVPMTLQLLGVLMCGYLLRPVMAVNTTLLYVVAGSLWPPIFSPGSLGLAGVTGGYLIGFVVVSGWIARSCHDQDSTIRLFVGGLVGLAVMFASAFVWVWLLFGISAERALLTTVVPFVPKAAVELGMAVWLTKRVRGWKSRSH